MAVVGVVVDIKISSNNLNVVPLVSLIKIKKLPADDAPVDLNPIWVTFVPSVDAVNSVTKLVVVVPDLSVVVPVILPTASLGVNAKIGVVFAAIIFLLFNKFSNYKININYFR
jgi:hypothetical protein